MHVKRHLSRLFGSLRLKAKADAHTALSEDEEKENKLRRSKSLREKVSRQLSTISIREKNKTSSRWQLLDTETNPESEEHCLSPPHNHPRSPLWENKDNLLNGQFEVPVLVEVRQAPTNTNTSPLQDDWSLRVHSATRSEHKDSEEESRATEKILLDSYLGYDYISNWTEPANSLPPSALPTLARNAWSFEEDGHGHQDDDYLRNREMFYDLGKSADKKGKKSSKLYRYASLRFRSFNKKNKKSEIGRSLSLRSIPMPGEETKSIDSKTRNRRVKLQKVKQQEVLDIIKPCDTPNTLSTTETSLGITNANPAKMHHYQTPNGIGKGFRKNIQRKLSIKALKKSGSGMGTMLKGGFAAIARTMVHVSSVAPHPYEGPPSSTSYDSYWGNDYHDYNTYKDYHYQMEYNRRRYDTDTNYDSIFFKKQLNQD